MSFVKRLTPQMSEYSKGFSDNGKVNWLPYTMYFHPYNYRSSVVNTDNRGFRYSNACGKIYSAADCSQLKRCRIIAGSSTVFGIGASSDCHTLSSRMSINDPHASSWINFGGRSFNSTQEMILFSLNRHLLPEIDEVVLMSGFNDLGLARLPARLRQEHGAFFMGNQFHRAMQGVQGTRVSRWVSRRKIVEHDDVPSLEAQISYAVDLTRRNLSNWSALCADMKAPLTFVLQPLANWVRSRSAKEEELLFAEREKLGGFAQQYGDILTQEAYTTYRDKLAAVCDELGISFIDLTSVIQASISDDFWLFVDRIHFTDEGHDIVARILIEQLAMKKRKS